MQTLVKRRSDGGIQEWSIEVEGNAFRVTSGKRNGKQKVNEWTYCVGRPVPAGRFVFNQLHYHDM